MAETQLHETRMGQALIQSTFPRIAKALEAIADGLTQGTDTHAGRFDPRELFLLLEAVEYYVAEIKTENDAEFAALLARLIVMTGRARATP